MKASDRFKVVNRRPNKEEKRKFIAMTLSEDGHMADIQHTVDQAGNVQTSMEQLCSMP